MHTIITNHNLTHEAKGTAHRGEQGVVWCGGGGGGGGVSVCACACACVGSRASLCLTKLTSGKVPKLNVYLQQNLQEVPKFEATKHYGTS